MIKISIKHVITLSLGGVLGILGYSPTHAQTPVLKVDLNVAERKAAEVNQPEYTPWAVRSGNTDILTLNGIKITLTNKGDAGTTLKTSYYKTAVQLPYHAKLAGDGLIATGGKLEMRISGLPTGPHTLLTYHNDLTGSGAGAPGPINIYVNGKLEVDKLVPSNRVKENTECKTAYIHFNAAAGKDVIVLFEGENGPDNINKSITLNGFELNTPNPINMARLPQPLSRDEHVNADAGKLVLSWTAAKTAVAHHIYFGTDSASIATATKTSPLFKGEMKINTYNAADLYSMLTYYWRVDEVDAAGKITKGNVWYFKPRQLAFKSAEGYGRFAHGGRGGKIVEVTNLNDDGPGSLREAVTNDIGPRTIVFAVSGIIQLKSRLVISQHNVTIAGQTAPGKGICISRAPLGIVADDAVIRFVRVRIGTGTTYDGMGITGADNSIVDHCSISWSIDESFSSRGAHNITLQRTLISEALNIAGHDHYAAGKAHGFAASIGGDVGSFHHNLLAHCAGRNWSLAGGVDGDGNYLGRMDIRNNVVYNWEYRATDGGARQVNFVGNYYKPGPSTTYMYALNAQHEGYGGGMQQYFFDGNVMPGRFNENNQSAGRTSTGRVNYITFVDEPFFEPYVKTQSATNAYKNVLSDVGCDQPFFDDHDTRIVNETLKGTYTYKGSKSGKAGLPDSQNDVGGWENYPEVHRAKDFDSDHDGLPDWWEELNQLNVHSDPGNLSDANNDKDHDGFTNLDDYLDWLSAPHYFTQPGKEIKVDLKQLARGYTDDPVFSIEEVNNGKAELSDKSTVIFKPVKQGLAKFTFMVKDASDSWFIRTVNIAVISTTPNN